MQLNIKLSKLRINLIVVCLSSLLSACSPLGVLNATISDYAYQLSDNVSYGPDVRHSLDIYQPKDNRRNARVLLFFYGGRWQSGNKEDYAFVGQAFASRGFVTVIADYRLHPQVLFPEFVDDGARAIAWLHNNIQDYGGDRQRIYLLGHSAGAHIASMLTLDETYLAARGVPQKVIRATVGLAGPYDFLPFTDRDIANVFAYGDPNLSQPIHYVNGTEAPMLLLSGSDDSTVKRGNTERLAQRIRRSGGVVEEHYYADIGHISILVAMASPLKSLAPVVRDTMRFLNKH